MRPIHMLTQMGVLNSCSISKKVTEDEINQFFKKHKKKGKTDDQIGDLLRDKISSEIQAEVLNGRVPGLISTDESINKKLGAIVSKHIREINDFSTEISNKMKSKKYDTLALCYFINSLVNLLNLTEKDFETFHDKMSSENDDSDEKSE